MSTAMSVSSGPVALPVVTVPKVVVTVPAVNVVNVSGASVNSTFVAGALPVFDTITV